MAGIITELQDLTDLSWAQARSSSGTAGTFLKAQSELGGRKIYYKLSNYDLQRGITGHECVNEIIADRLLALWNIEHLEYTLIHGRICLDGREMETWLCASEDFKKPGERKLALDAFYALERQGEETLLQFCTRMGWQEYIAAMLAVDHILLNRDRHGGNLEVLKDSKQRTLRLAPLFDHGLSLFCRAETEEQLQREDPMAEKTVQCCVGGRSAFENLSLVPRGSLPALRPLTAEDRAQLFEGLDGVISPLRMEMIWNMIVYRWHCYEDLRHQG